MPRTRLPRITRQMREFLRRYIEAGQPANKATKIYRDVYGPSMSEHSARIRVDALLSDPTIGRELDDAKLTGEKYALPTQAKLNKTKQAVAKAAMQLDPDSVSNNVPDSATTLFSRNVPVISKNIVAEHLASIGFADIRDIITWDDDGRVCIRASRDIPDATARAITSVKVTKKPDGTRGIEFKLAPKTQALMGLARLQGWLVDPVENKDPPPTPPEVAARRERMMAAIRDFMREAARPAPLTLTADEENDAGA